jgi:hypothetical protein
VGFQRAERHADGVGRLFVREIFEKTRGNRDAFVVGEHAQRTPHVAFHRAVWLQSIVAAGAVDVIGDDVGDSTLAPVRQKYFLLVRASALKCDTGRAAPTTPCCLRRGTTTAPSARAESKNARTMHWCPCTTRCERLREQPIVAANDGTTDVGFAHGTSDVLKSSSMPH